MDVKGINNEYILPQQATWQEPDIKKKSEPSVKPIEESQLDGLRTSSQDDRDRLEEGKFSQEQLEQLVHETKDVLEDINKGIRFSISKDTGDIVVQVINRKTDEVIRQIPPEELLKLRTKLKEICGILFDRKV